MPLILCRLCGELVNSNSERCKCGGSTRQTSTLATSPSDGNVDRWQKKYASPLSAPPSLPKPSSSSTSTVQELPSTSLHPPPSPSLSKTYGSLLSLSSPLSCVSCSRPFPPDATLYPAKAPSSNPNYFSPPEEETYKCRSCYTKEDRLGECEKCGKAVLGVKEMGGSGRGEGKFVRSGKRLWCQGCFACDGCSTLLRPTPAHPPLLHPITSKPICEDCLFNPPQSPSGPSSARRPLPQRTTLSSSSSNLGGFGPSRSTSSMSGGAAPPNAAVEELRSRLGIASISLSASRTSLTSRVESSPLPSSSASVTRPRAPPSSISCNAPRIPTSTSTSRTSAPPKPPRPSPPSSSSSAPDDTCPSCTGLLTAPPLSSTPTPRRSPYDRAPPPVLTIALITLPTQLGGQTFHAVCFRCDGCGDALVAAEGEDAQVGVGVNERGKGVCMKCVQPSRFSVSSSTRSIPASTSTPISTAPRPRYQSNPTPSAPPPPANPLRSSYSRGGNASPSGVVPPPASVSAAGRGAGPKKLSGSILERAGVKKRVDR